jgi:hypothetical protein
MANYLVAYDLMAPGQRYPAVEKAIQAQGTACKLLNTTWYLKSGAALNAVRDAIWAVMDANDKLLVVQAENAAPANLPAACWQTVQQQWNQ